MLHNLNCKNNKLQANKSKQITLTTKLIRLKKIVTPSLRLKFAQISYIQHATYMNIHKATEGVND